MSEFQKALQELDLSDVVAQVQEELGLSESDALRAEELYKQFLTLCFKYPEKQVVPPKLADFVWHEHITDTRKYEADCNQLFGKFMHHVPTKESSTNAYEETKSLYQQEFSVNLEQYGLRNQELYRASNCSN